MLKFVIHQNHNAEKHLLGRFRLSVTTRGHGWGLSLPESLACRAQRASAAKRTASRPETAADGLHDLARPTQGLGRQENDRGERGQEARARGRRSDQAEGGHRSAQAAPSKTTRSCNAAARRCRAEQTAAQDNRRLTAVQDLGLGTDQQPRLPVQPLEACFSAIGGENP